MVIQVDFEVPREIATGLASGELTRFGGVVRNSAGRVVAHLKEVPVVERATEEFVKRAGSSLKNPRVAVTAGAMTLVAVGGGVIYAAKKRKKSAEQVVPVCVQNYSRSLQAYLEAIQSGNLDLDIINQLREDLNAVIAYEDHDGAVIAFSPEQLSVLSKILADYTGELVKMNDPGLLEEVLRPEGSEGARAVDLKRHLDLQREVFGRMC